MTCFRPGPARVAAALLLLACAAPAAVQLEPYAATVREFKLANGLSVTLIEDHGAPVVTACLTARGGFADDPKGMRGMASLVPLLLEQGPEQLGSRDLTQERAAIKAMTAAYTQLKALELKPGASALYDRMRAESNLKMVTRSAESLAKPQFSTRAMEFYGAQPFRVTASADHIQWFARLPSNRVDAFLLLYGEWLKQPVPRMVSAGKERRAQEFAQLQRNADMGVRQVILPLAFGPSGYGLMEWENTEMERTSYLDVESFVKSRLVASNLTLTLAGDLTLETAQALAEKYMSKVPAGVAFTPAPWKAAEPKERRAAPPKESANAIAVAYRRPPETDPDDAVMDLIEELMLEGSSSRVRKEFLTKYPMIPGYLPFGSLPGSRHGGLMVTIIPHHPAKTPKVWIDLLGEFMEDLGKTPVDADLIARAQQSIEGRLLNALADPSSAAQHIGRMGGWTRVAELAKAWAKVTPADVQRVAAQYLRPELRVILQPGYDAATAGAGVSK